MSSIEKRLSIPTIFASQHLENLLNICHPILSTPAPLKIIFDFRQCRFLAHHAVAVMGSVAHHLKVHNGFLSFELETLSPPIRMNLAQNGLLNYLGHSEEPWDGNSIPFRHDLTFDQAHIIDYLSHRWLGKGWLNISQNLKEEIIAQVLEIYLNAFEHGQSQFGVFTCGQYYPQKKRLKLTILDRGVGIPQNVRSFRNIPNFSAAQAIEWAFAQGNSTQPISHTPRGIGLDNLRSFICANQGKLQVYSHDACAKITGNDQKYGGQIVPFQGTMVNIDLVCNSDYYCLSSELGASEQPFF